MRVVEIFTGAASINNVVVSIVVAGAAVIAGVAADNAVGQSREGVVVGGAVGDDDGSQLGFQRGSDGGDREGEEGEGGGGLHF
jgi:hypothetical protein